MIDKPMVLIGGGAASAAAAEELRKQGHDGPVTLVTRELMAPYHRPPTSKRLLDGDRDDLAILPDAWWKDNDVELLTRSPVMSMDTDAHVIRLANKREIEYDKALVATGAMVRRIHLEQGGSQKGIHYLRAPMNAASVRADLEDATHVVVIGGSFIAVEVAAEMRRQGRACTMIIREGRCLSRSFGPSVSDFVDGLLMDKGVEMLRAVEPTSFLGDDRVTGVLLSDGRVVPADVVIIGAGVTPDVKLARSAGLELGQRGGVLCNSRLETSAADVYAAGDVCEYDSVLHGAHVRIEHERHAQEQGRTVARNMLGQHVDHRVVPYFWSEIADWATLEAATLTRTPDLEVVTGSVADAQFTMWQFERGALKGAVSVGRPEDIRVCEQVLLGQRGLPPELKGSVLGHR